MVVQLPEMTVSPAWKGKNRRLCCVDVVSTSWGGGGGGDFPTFGGGGGRNPKEKKKKREMDSVEFVQLNDFIVLFPPPGPAEQIRAFLGCY